MEADALIKLIEDAFPTHPMPEQTLRQTALSDQGMAREISAEEWESAGRIDRDVPWTALSDDDLMECTDAIQHLWGPSLTYYLGALLRFAVRHLDANTMTREWDLVHSVIFLVTYKYADRRDFDRHWAWLNANQIEVVRRFLEAVAARSERFQADATRALQRHWNSAQPVEPDYCPVCACALPLPPQGDHSPRTDACPSCGIRFGIDDAVGGYLVRRTVYDHWRAQWISARMPWRSQSIQKLEGWNPAMQLARLKRKS
ncbi:MAG TPA: DUF6714 family protein [Dongiaceae bacterium]|nr:DUF6714 family protein [Dongiaceae bacterium]